MIKIKDKEGNILIAIQRSSLININLSNNILYNANLQAAQLYGAKLCESNLEGADLRNANLGCADLSNTNLRNNVIQQLRQVELSQRKVRQKIFYKSIRSFRALGREMVDSVCPI